MRYFYCHSPDHPSRHLHPIFVIDGPKYPHSLPHVNVQHPSLPAHQHEQMQALPPPPPTLPMLSARVCTLDYHPEDVQRRISRKPSTAVQEGFLPVISARAHILC